MLKDSCPDGDNSSSYYDQKCDLSSPKDDTIEQATTEPVTTEPVISHQSAIQTNTCKYSDGNFQEYVFRDVLGTEFDTAVSLLLKNCIVHGHKNE